MLLYTSETGEPRGALTYGSPLCCSSRRSRASLTIPDARWFTVSKTSTGVAIDHSKHSTAARPRTRRGSGAAAVAALVILAGPAEASGTLGYGSRAGMEVDVVSMSGLNTAHAVIATKHTRANAVAFCRDYVKKVTSGCIRDELAVRLNDSVTADCTIGEFVNFQGNSYRFAGPSQDKDASAKYRLIDLATGEDADGSSASGYSTNLQIFKALCPLHGPQDE